MPNSSINDDKLDRQLSDLLNASEPPRSPEHLDESILSYARAQAQKNHQAVNADKKSSADRGWYRQKWVPAAVTFSIAAIAVTVSLQDFGPDDFEPGFSDLASSSEIALQDNLPELADNPTEVIEPAATRLSIQNAPIQPQGTQPIQLVNQAAPVMETEPAAEQLEQRLDPAGAQTTAAQTQQERANVTTTAASIPTTSVLPETPESPVQVPTSQVQADAEIRRSTDSANNNGASLTALATPTLETDSGTTRSAQPGQAPALARQQQNPALQPADSDDGRARNQRDEVDAVSVDTGAAAVDAKVDTDANNTSVPDKPAATNAAVAGIGVLAGPQVEEVVVTGSYIRGNRSAVASTIVELDTTPDNAALADLLRSDSAAQHNFISLLEQVLNPSNQVGSVASGALTNLIERSTSAFTRRRENVVSTDVNELANRRERLIELYGRLTEPGQYLSLANRYQQLRSTDSDLPTPETLDFAIEVLELLGQ